MSDSGQSVLPRGSNQLNLITTLGGFMMHDWWQHIANSGASILTGLGGAVIGVALDFRRHTWATALLAIVSGVFVAYLGTDPIIGVLGLPDNASNAIAALLGISGRNLLLWVLTVSQDPVSLWDRIRGKS